LVPTHVDRAPPTFTPGPEIHPVQDAK